MDTMVAVEDDNRANNVGSLADPITEASNDLIVSPSLPTKDTNDDFGNSAAVDQGQNIIVTTTEELPALSTEYTIFETDVESSGGKIGLCCSELVDTNATSESKTSNVNTTLAEQNLPLESKLDIPLEYSHLELNLPLMEQGDVESTETESMERLPMTPIFWDYRFAVDPVCLAVTEKTEFLQAKYMRGCKWAPDGSCLLTNSDDSCMRIFNLPPSFHDVRDWKSFCHKDESWNSALNIKEGGLVYDYCWYPLMNSGDPISSCFLTTSSNSPVHLWDAFTGALRCSYRAYDQFDEVTAAFCTAFSTTGEYIYCGFDKCIRIFNVARPGRECIERKLKHKDFPTLSQSGIISCIAISPSSPALYACGSYRNTIGLYMEDGTVLCTLDGHLGGLTHLKFSHDGTKLFSGGRKDSRLICWDIRNLGDTYQILNRQVDTNQRIYFDTSADDRLLVSGGTDGKVVSWNLRRMEDSKENINDDMDYTNSRFEEGKHFLASSDCINGVSLNPYIPVLATTSGQRHFKDVAADSDDELFVETESFRRSECGVRLWKLT